MQLLSCVFCCALVGASIRADEPKQAWSVIKGRVVFPEDKPLPVRAALNVNQDKVACLKDGPILDEATIVNPKNRGIRNVVVFLRPLDTDVKEFPAKDIHPDDAKRKPAEVVIDQPCCMFLPRVAVARVGDTLVVKNSAPITHNIFWASEKNGNANQNIPGGKEWKLPNPLVLERTPIQYKCTIHPWMTGYVRIFDHPYYAVTDADGNFEIKNAPVGKFRIVFWHETGIRGGVKGRFGDPLDITGPTMEMKPTDFDISPK